jgi:hypothetical protein
MMTSKQIVDNIRKAVHEETGQTIHDFWDHPTGVEIGFCSTEEAECLEVDGIPVCGEFLLVASNGLNGFNPIKMGEIVAKHIILHWKGKVSLENTCGHGMSHFSERNSDKVDVFVSTVRNALNKAGIETFDLVSG